MAWLNYSDGQGLLPQAMCAAAVHEIGHWAAIRILGGRVTQLRLSAVGAEMHVEGIIGYGSEILCAVAGPLVNFLMALAMAQMEKMVFSGLNFAMAIFNLLPLRALDGGRALYCAACMFFGPHWGHWLIVRLEWIWSVLLLLCGGIVVGTGGNVTLLVVAVWLVCALCRTTDKTWRKKGLSRNV